MQRLEVSDAVRLII